MKSFLRVFLPLALFVLIFLPGLTRAQSLDELLKQGDDYTAKFDNQKALDVYLQADKVSPNNWEVYWRISRAYVDIAQNMPEKTDEEKDAQLAEYQKGYDYADKAVKLAPGKSITYLRRAIANGRIALFKGVFSVGGIVNSVKSDCEKAIALNNGGDYWQAIAHYVLARTNAKVSEKWAPARAVLGLGWADLDVAITEYKKAIALFPNFRMFYLDLARAYIRDDEYKSAREMLQKVLESPKKDQDDDKRITEAKQLLKDIEDE